MNESILLLTYPLNCMLMIFLPVGLGMLLTRRFDLRWRLFWIGGATFLLSQVVHIPVNLLIDRLFTSGAIPMPPPAWELPIFAAIGGLSAGLFEETARYAAFRWWAREARTWRQALLLGAGHGGIESIALGLLALTSVISMFAVRGADLSTLVPADQLPYAQQQVVAFWSMPWYGSLLGALERALTIPVQIGLSVLVLQAFTRRQIGWLFLAILWHAAIDGIIAGYLMPIWVRQFDGAIYAVEGAVAVTTALSLGLIFLLRRREAPVTAPEPAAAPRPAPVFRRRGVAETRESLEDTRYHD
jgi:uncharacterized membrane protein YhfC